MPVRRLPAAAVRCAALAALLVLGACASPSKDGGTPLQPEPQPAAKAQEVSPQNRSELHAELGAGYYERGQMDVAIEELNNALKLDPNNAKAYNTFGLVYAVLGESAKAEQSFQRALTLAPQDAEIRQNWGFYLCTHGRAKESIPEFEQAARNPLYKTPEIPLLNAGRCSVSIGDTAQAEAYFKRALAAAPGYEGAAFGIAQIAYKSGRYDEARRWMRQIRPTNLPPDALYLGMCIEKKLGDRQAEASYVAQLRNRYPESTETLALAAGICE